jgi:enterochelin esterase-like enzyme
MANDLLKRAQETGTPLIDGEKVTFIWQGGKAPLLLGDFNDWETSQALRLKKIEPQIWAAELSLPRDAYIEYAFFRGEAHVPDPFNPNLVDDGFGKDNYYFYMPDAGPTPFVRPEKEIPRGRVTRYTVETGDNAAGARRTVFLYQPPVEEPVPLLVVWDGREYLHRASLATLANNLIHKRCIRPLALALVCNGGQARTIEYSCSEATLAFLIESVLPLASQNMNLLDIQSHPGAFGVLGSSLGGLMALFTGLRLPQVFGKVLSQSGAFTIEEYDSVVYALIKQMPKELMQIWLDVGKFESLLDVNRRFFPLLQEKGFSVSYREYSGGHNFTAWRDDVWRGLVELFPPAL